MTELDDDDWVDLDVGASACADVTLRLCIPKNSKKEKKRARAWLTFRREAMTWICDNAPRFRVQVGANGELVRIVPDARGGKFEANEFKGVVNLRLGHVLCWPDEQRERVAVEWDVTKDGMRLKLPAGFAQARAK